jgi:Transcriptional regulators containing a DNA-binding HTH domain and an aminotransferase domain (MocR family) and their eukaryotic orthologs
MTIYSFTSLWSDSMTIYSFTSLWSDSMTIYSFTSLWSDSITIYSFTLRSDFMTIYSFTSLWSDSIFILYPGLGTWAIPQGGMFLWVTLKPVKDLRSLVTEQCVREKLLVAPGYAFNIDSKDSNQYIRISYSVATEEQAQEVRG